MFKNLLQVYALLSCLIYSIITLVVLAGSINHATFYFFPELETRDSFFEHKIFETLHPELKKLPPEAIEQRKKEKIKMSNLTHLVKGLPWAILSFVLLCIHVIIYKKSKHEA